MAKPPEESQSPGSLLIPRSAIAASILVFVLLALFVFFGGGWVQFVALPLAIILGCLLVYIVLTYRLFWHTLAVAVLGLGIFGYVRIHDAFNEHKKQIADLQGQLRRIEQNAASKNDVNFINGRLGAADGDRRRIHGRLGVLDRNHKLLQSQLTANVKQLNELSDSVHVVEYKEVPIQSDPQSTVPPPTRVHPKRRPPVVRPSGKKAPFQPGDRLTVGIKGESKTLYLRKHSRIVPIGGVPLSNSAKSRALLRAKTIVNLRVDSRTNTIIEVKIIAHPSILPKLGGPERPK